MISLTTDNFDSEVLQSDIPVVVLWGMPMNVNSNLIAIAFKKLRLPNVKFSRVDIDAEPELVMRFTIRDVPLLVLFVDGLAIAQDTTLSDTFKEQVIACSTQSIDGQNS